MRLLSLLMDGKLVAEVPIRQSVSKRLAMLCAEPTCEAIYEAGTGPQGEPDSCPRCGCREAWPVGKLDRYEVPA